MLFSLINISPSLTIIYESAENDQMFWNKLMEISRKLTKQSIVPSPITNFCDYVIFLYKNRECFEITTCQQVISLLELISGKLTERFFLWRFPELLQNPNLYIDTLYEMNSTRHLIMRNFTTVEGHIDLIFDRFIPMISIFSPVSLIELLIDLFVEKIRFVTNLTDIANMLFERLLPIAQSKECAGTNASLTVSAFRALIFIYTLTQGRFSHEHHIEWYNQLLEASFAQPILTEIGLSFLIDHRITGYSKIQLCKSIIDYIKPNEKMSLSTKSSSSSSDIKNSSSSYDIKSSQSEMKNLRSSEMKSSRSSEIRNSRSSEMKNSHSSEIRNPCSSDKKDLSSSSSSDSIPSISYSSYQISPKCIYYLTDVVSHCNNKKWLFVIQFLFDIGTSNFFLRLVIIENLSILLKGEIDKPIQNWIISYIRRCFQFVALSKSSNKYFNRIDTIINFFNSLYSLNIDYINKQLSVCYSSLLKSGKIDPQNISIKDDESFDPDFVHEIDLLSKKPFNLKKLLSDNPSVTMLNLTHSASSSKANQNLKFQVRPRSIKSQGTSPLYRHSKPPITSPHPNFNKTTQARNKSSMIQSKSSVFNSSTKFYRK